MRRVLIIAAALSLALYAGDYAAVRMRRDPTGVVQIRRYYAIPQKNNRTLFSPAEPVSQTCVHSLFPHLGDSPCWYVSRHAQQRIDM
jgi:hypothetical protein